MFFFSYSKQSKQGWGAGVGVGAGAAWKKQEPEASKKLADSPALNPTNP